MTVNLKSLLQRAREEKNVTRSENHNSFIIQTVAQPDALPEEHHKTELRRDICATAGLSGVSISSTSFIFLAGNDS